MTVDKHCHFLSVLNQVLKRIAYLQKDKHGPVWNETQSTFYEQLQGFEQTPELKLMWKETLSLHKYEIAFNSENINIQLITVVVHCWHPLCYKFDPGVHKYLWTPGLIRYNQLTTNNVTVFEHNYLDAFLFWPFYLKLISLTYISLKLISNRKSANPRGKAIPLIRRR